MQNADEEEEALDGLRNVAIIVDVELPVHAASLDHLAGLLLACEAYGGEDQRERAGDHCEGECEQHG